jgi:hypothetical protein
VILEEIFKYIYIEELLEEIVMWEPLYVCLDCGVESLNVDVKKVVWFFFFFLFEM